MSTIPKPSVSDMVHVPGIEQTGLVLEVVTLDEGTDTEHDVALVLLTTGIWAWPGSSDKPEGDQAVAFVRTLVVSVDSLEAV